MRRRTLNPDNGSEEIPEILHDLPPPDPDNDQG
jgi:hypothetical protein